MNKPYKKLTYKDLEDMFEDVMIFKYYDTLSPLAKKEFDKAIKEEAIRQGIIFEEEKDWIKHPEKYFTIQILIDNKLEDYYVLKSEWDALR